MSTNAKTDEAFANRLMELAKRDADRASGEDSTGTHRQVALFMIDELSRAAIDLNISDTTAAALRELARALRIQMTVPTSIAA
ncbi:MAG: hypothetical protein AAGB34_08905 [Planctomycetota bacterium]